LRQKERKAEADHPEREKTQLLRRPLKLVRVRVGHLRLNLQSLRDLLEGSRYIRKEAKKMWERKSKLMNRSLKKKKK
jgi:hypothetical protein